MCIDYVIPSGAVMELTDAIIRTNEVDNGTSNLQKGIFVMFRGVGSFESVKDAEEYLRTDS